MLDPSRWLQRSSFRLSKQCEEGFVVCLKNEVMTINIGVEAPDGKDAAESFLVQLRIVSSAADRDLEAKAIGLSSLDGILWDRTAPMPYEEASLTTTNSKSGL